MNATSMHTAPKRTRRYIARRNLSREPIGSLPTAVRQMLAERVVLRIQQYQLTRRILARDKQIHQISTRTIEYAR